MKYEMKLRHESDFLLVKTFLFAGMHRKSIEVAQHYSSKDKKDMSGGEGGRDSNGNSEDGDIKAHQHHYDQSIPPSQDEDFRSNSIAQLRAKAQQHSAKLHADKPTSNQTSNHIGNQLHHHLGL